MNQYGSYRALLGNSIGAMLAAIEIYNKPTFSYRSECFVILLLNAWELMFKATLSKNKVRIFYPKVRGEPYRTLTLWDAMKETKQFFPSSISYQAVSENISLLVDYRNNAVHFYNEEGMDVIVYGLAQTAIVNFRDLIQEIFGRDIAEEVNISLLPLSFSAPPDPISFIGNPSATKSKPLVAEYMRVISETTKELEREHIDTGRFLTVFEVSLQSTKKISSADIVAGISEGDGGSLFLVNRKVDPNKSHPHLRKDVVKKIGSHLKGVKFSTYTFDAIVWHKKYKDNEQMCWHNEKARSYQYSGQLISAIKSLTKNDIELALQAYKQRPKSS